MNPQLDNFDYEILNGTLYLEGVINYSTIIDKAESLKSDIDSSVTEINCKNIVFADSTALSVLLMCIRKTGNKKMKITSMNRQLSKLAQLYGLSKLLGPL